MTELHFQTASALAARLRDKEISASELVEHFIARIEKHDGDINAVVVRDFDAARTRAREADAALARGESWGPLHGVPMTIKESYNRIGLPTTWGIPLMKDNIAESDSESVIAYENAGAILLGKTNAPLNLADFQSYNDIYGTTGNPWDTGRTPGGSSGGSAAALAAGFSALESGSDIGGSIRNPAHFCGVYGHKPTWTIVPPQGHALPGALASPDLAVMGPLARSAEDLALALDVLAMPEPLQRRGWKVDLPDPRHKTLADFRVALWADQEQAPVDAEVVERVHHIGDTLAKLGATVSAKARPSFDVARSHETYLMLLNSVMSSALPPETYAEQAEAARQLDPDDTSQAAMTLRGSVLSHRDWLRFNNQREQLRYAWQAFFEDWDILLCPQTTTPAFPHDHGPFGGRTIEVNGAPQPYFAQLFWAGLITVAYLPSTVFPTGLSRAGLPIGLQAVTAECDDRTSIEFARLMAQEIGGFQAPPL